MREATAVLMRLDVARWEPVAADVLQHQAGNGDPATLPPSSPPRAQHVLDCALRMLTIVEVARQSDGAAVTSVEADGRSAGAARPRHGRPARARSRLQR